MTINPEAPAEKTVVDPSELEEAAVDSSTQEPLPIVSVGADIDVMKLTEDIKAEVARKLESGAYPADLMAELEAETDSLGTALDSLRNASMLPFQPDLRSPHRVIGPLAMLGKRGMRRAFRWYSQWLLTHLNHFASNVVVTTGVMVDHLKSQEASITRLGKQVEREREENRLRYLKLRHTLLETARLRGESKPSEVSTGPAAASGRARSAQVAAAMDYVEFEDRFRGSTELISGRQSAYLELYRNGKGKVVDLGCGRGEFLTLLREADIPSYGVDMSAEMVELCKSKGLKVEQGDALDHLASLPEASLGGIFCAQVIEHLDPIDITRLFVLAAATLVEGGILVVETLNPQSLATFTNALYVDLGHLRPLHPLTLSFLAESAGFHSVGVKYSSPSLDKDRLKLLPDTQDEALKEFVAILNANLQRMDDVLFGPQDFAVIAKR
jgi:O-antigen chain-terminating methyltransferase